MWYVTDYLIPSMLSQGIPADCILVYRDCNELGNLRAFIDSCNRTVTQCERHNIDGIWHLQDDVIISKDFADKTQQYDRGVVCGFTCDYDKAPEAGVFRIYQQKMWFSFPCIRIPTNILRAFVDWANLNLWQSNYFKSWVKRNKADDLIFREWLYDNYPDMSQLNLAPNIVNHVDKYIGGSVVNTQRDKDQDTMSIFWKDRGEIQEVLQFLHDKQFLLDNHENI